MEVENTEYAILHIESHQNNLLDWKWGITIGLGNRGMHFENFINPLNEMYQRGRVALINKRPTPVKVLKSSDGHVLNGFYKAKSTVDYDGV